MKTLHTAAMLCAMLSPWTAPAAAPPTPAPAVPLQYGSCPLAQAPRAEPPAAPAGVKPAAAPQRKINVEVLFDPCHMVDAERASDEAPSDGVSPTQRLELYQDVMELNRRQGGAAQPEAWWRLAAPSGPGQSMAAAPEPQGYPMWLAGLALLALAARRRAQRR